MAYTLLNCRFDFEDDLYARVCVLISHVSSSYYSRVYTPGIFMSPTTTGGEGITFSIVRPCVN